MTKIKDYGELFDLTSDPDEQHNLFRSTQTVERRLNMMQRLIGALAREIYPFPRGENSRFQRLISHENTKKC